MEDYTVRWPFVHECIKRLGVEPPRDCFADEWNRRCSLFYSKESDALTKVWPKKGGDVGEPFLEDLATSGREGHVQ